MCPLKTKTLNPVYPHNCPDPFCLKFNGEYWCYCTGRWSDGKIFGILHSTDLVNWLDVGGAMAPLAENHLHYWAPEVFYDNGVFYLYYSAGDEVNMHLRVATAQHPAGPFVDSGHRLTQEKFAIDAHVFEDDDGARYLFYACDHFERERVGTGTVLDRMLSPYRLEGKPRPVSLPAYDWQIYDPQRAEKDNLRWHTIEGSFTLKHKGLYYQMFSGGNYQNPSYGVGYAVTENIETPGEWRQVIDGESVLPVLRTVPGKVDGPGHNSVVVGPDNRQLYCVYHVIQSHQPLVRALAIDPLDWVGSRLAVFGPSYNPQPAPRIAANPLDLARTEQGDGRWVYNARVAAQERPDGTGAFQFKVNVPYFLLETWVQSLGVAHSAEVEHSPGVDDPPGDYGLALIGRSGDELLRLRISRARNAVVIHTSGAGRPAQVRTYPLPGDFNFAASVPLRLEVNGRSACLSFGPRFARQTAALAEETGAVALFTERERAVFSGLALTGGWEDRFDGADTTTLADYGWRVLDEAGQWQVQSGLLRGRTDDLSRIAKPVLFENYELVINARRDSGGRCLIAPAATSAASGPVVWLEQDDGGACLVVQTGQTEEQSSRYPLPVAMDTVEFHQLRFVKHGDSLHIALEAHRLAEVAVPAEKSGVMLAVRGGAASFDMVRLTEIV
jgi:GH43 family beta-xylosidase